jgi:Fe-S-cluster-containing dehydrogenase component
MACVVACQDQNDIVSGSTAYRRVTSLEEGTGNDCKLSFLSLSCLHCEDAPCLMNCPTCAISKDDAGVVSINRDLCIGCHSCELNCPFGAPKFAEDLRMAKCDFCHDRVEAGLEPACVRVCSTRALNFGPLEQLSQEKVKNASIKILRSFDSAIVNKENS